jgi:hypothetical protein
LSDKELENYAQEFAKGLNQMNSYLFNPLITNQALKKINMNPIAQTREDIKNIVSDPKLYEKQSRQLSEYLYNTQTPYKRLVHYFADMLKFELSIYPTNASEEDLKSDKFKKDYDKIWLFLDNFNYKREFQKIVLGMMVEDGKFMYLRTDGSNYTLQEMPTDYCIIDAWSDLGWLYSFDLLYFQSIGVDINSFAPSFKRWYKEALEMQVKKINHPSIRAKQRNNGTWSYYKAMQPSDAWVFKFDYPFAGLVPPFLGIFLDAIDIDTFKGLFQTKTEIEAYKMIVGTVPRNKDNKGGNSKDDFAYHANTLAQFMTYVKNDLPPGLMFKALPLEDIKEFNFENSGTTHDVVGSAMKNFYRSSGTDQALFNADKPNASSIKAATRMDSAFVEIVYPQFATFIDFHINKLTKKFKFRTSFSGTIYDEEDRVSTAFMKLSSGIITPDIPAAFGMNEKQFRTGLQMMASFGYPEFFKPVQNANQMASNQVGGRPPKKTEDLTGSGELTRDKDANNDGG